MIPGPLLAAHLQSKLGEYSLDAHANAAPDEIRQLIAEIRTLVRDTSIPTPALDQLYRDMDSIPASIPLTQSRYSLSQGDSCEGHGKR